MCEKGVEEAKGIDSYTERLSAGRAVPPLLHQRELRAYSCTNIITHTHTKQSNSQLEEAYLVWEVDGVLRPLGKSQHNQLDMDH